jgi:hypothetical protein
MSCLLGRVPHLSPYFAAIYAAGLIAVQLIANTWPFNRHFRFKKYYEKSLCTFDQPIRAVQALVKTRIPSFYSVIFSDFKLGPEVGSGSKVAFQELLLHDFRLE